MNSPLENDSQHTPPGRLRWLWWVLLGTALFILAAFLFPVARICNPIPRHTAARSDAAKPSAALKHYHVEYGNWPIGDHARILAVLRGDNPRKIVFFEAQPDRYNLRGEFLDPWKTPYRVNLSDPDVARVYSCGKDQQDNGGATGSDDVPSWR